MSKITTNLWFNGNAEEAANFYVSLFPNSRVDNIVHAPAENPSTPKGAVILVEFTLDGRSFSGLNGGPAFPFTEAVSFVIDCADQAEVDRYWDTLIANGGSASQCGWCKDRFGLSWQVTPRVLLDAIAKPGPASTRAFQAMMQMSKIDVAKIEMAIKGE